MDTAAGVYAAVLTPYERDLSPSIELLASHCRNLLEKGCHGLAILGTTGEANSLTVEERVRILEGVVAAGIDPDVLMPGTGCCAIDDTVVLTKRALALGINRVLMLPPFFYKFADDNGLFAAYASIVDRIADPRLRVYLYNIPQVSGIAISEALIERLTAAYPITFAGAKDSSRNLESLRAKAAIPNFRVFAGTERLMLTALEAGGVGCIAAVVNSHPAEIRALYDRANMPEALELQARLRIVADAIEAAPTIASLKMLFARRSGDERWLGIRPPLRPLSTGETERLFRELDGVSAAA
jgi:4-hydroxy-tetrahydrodipicolinate synthase